MHYWMLIATNQGVVDTFLLKTSRRTLNEHQAVEMLREADPDLHCWTIEDELTWSVVAVEPELALDIGD